MKKISLVALGFLVSLSIAAEEPNLDNVDKLDILDKQSKEFFKAITGLEKDYLEEQISAIKTKEDESLPNNKPGNIITQPQGIIRPTEPVLSPEDYEKNVFKHQNEMARLTTDFTRTKKLKDIKIKSMYSFNSKNYVVLELDAQKAASSKAELSSQIEGRYIVGDYILGHKIVSINTRTKNLELYKKLDEEYGYSIYLSNYGISVSDLKKIPKIEKEELKSTNKEKKVNNIENDENKIKKAFDQISDKSKKEDSKNLTECLYTVNVSNLNVRNNADNNATILRILRKYDQFTIKDRVGEWVHLDTIFKKISGDVMPVEDEDNWLQIVDDNVSATDNTCM